MSDMHAIEVRILYKHDKTETYLCNDLPGIGGDWITLYMQKDLQRVLIPSNGIAELSYRVVTLPRERCPGQTKGKKGSKATLR